MEYVQPWAQPRQGYPQGSGYRPTQPGGTQRPPYQGPAQPPVTPNTGTGNLSREERQEAKRLSEEANFTFSGYQVVRREFISHRFDPAMTIRGNSITFNNSCISKLEDATYVQFLINPTERKLAIRPCSEGARDAIRWCVTRDDKRKSRQITCGLFTAKLYDMMGWEALYRYKLQGMRITYQGECLYLFDLSAKEAFLPQTRDPETGKLNRSTAILDTDWLGSFGMSVDEHAASTQIDLSDGYVSSDLTGAEEGSPDATDNTEVS